MNISFFFPFMQVTVTPYRHKFLSLEFMYTILSMILFKSSITLSENKIHSNDHFKCYDQTAVAHRYIMPHHSFEYIILFEYLPRKKKKAFLNALFM